MTRHAASLGDGPLRRSARALGISPSGAGKHAVLLIYTAVAVFPIALVVMNSLKSRSAIFDAPVQPPTPGRLTEREHDWSRTRTGRPIRAE